ncbi:MAG: transcriptional regulator [Vicingaceae bacterium]
MPKLNPILHQELRLSIVSYLVTIEKADFNRLLEVTSASKGNLSVQITSLQKAGYIQVNKSFKGNYPHTQCKITAAGRTAFEQYLKDLKTLLNLS